MLTCMIERTCKWRGTDDIPGAYCDDQKIIPMYDRPSSNEIIGELIARKWSIQVEHLEDLVDQCESCSGDKVVIDKYSDPRYNYYIIIYDDYIE